MNGDRSTMLMGTILIILATVLSSPTLAQEANAPSPPLATSLQAQLDAPLLFTKRHSYTGIHIYDTYYKWPPGGGGIYVLQNPSAPQVEWLIRPVIDPTTPETLGDGVYTDPEISWDARRILFCFKGEPTGNTSIYEIGVDGTGLRRLTDPGPTCEDYKGRNGGQHDVCPAYLPDGRIVFLSTRPSGLVPCNNTGVAVLHVMNADGSDIHPISVNNVNEFDPVVLPDGRIMFGRWEYVDKNALTIQSLWTMNPDGTQETALFANNMVFPEAILDARPIPNSNRILGTFAKHNSTPRGSLAIVDPRLGKNALEAINNLEHPDDATFDRGDSCEPWAVSEDVLIFSGRRPGQERSVIEIMNLGGTREVLLSDPDICLHSPMLIKPRPLPRILPDTVDRQARTGRFYVQDIYRGLSGVERGEVKWLRVIEETSRVSASPGGTNPYNQTFLVSCALAFSVKNFLGMVPVNDDGSAFFEVPAGRAVYLQALDAEGRLVQSMRTFVQASPGTTRSCIGCHEHKNSTADRSVAGVAPILGSTPSRLQPESWGSGHLDYPSMVQPVLDRHCAECHGGPGGFAGGLDLTGGWTEHFNISYENLTSRRETQLVAYWIAGIDCMNGTALWSAQIFPPRFHGSGAAPLAQLLIDGHAGYIDNLTRQERDLLMAWIDTNGLYYGSWNHSPNGCAVQNWPRMRTSLVTEMRAAGCLECHGRNGQPFFFEEDWVNLQEPRWSRLLRAPLAKRGDDGMGQELCRNRPIEPNSQRVRLLCNGYAHAVQPPEQFPRRAFTKGDTSGKPFVTFNDEHNAHYQAMLRIIREARAIALSSPRVDMPGASVVAGSSRLFVPPPVPSTSPPLSAVVHGDGTVQLQWLSPWDTIGLSAQLHRSDNPEFVPSEESLRISGHVSEFLDHGAPAGIQHYKLVIADANSRSMPSEISVDVPVATAPPPPNNLSIVSSINSIHLAWQDVAWPFVAYRVYRRQTNQKAWTLVSDESLAQRNEFIDTNAEPNIEFEYIVRSISARGLESADSNRARGRNEVILEPVFATRFARQPTADLWPGKVVPGRLVTPANCENNQLDLRGGGHLTFEHQPHFDLQQPLSLECWIHVNQETQMPVYVSCGAWNQTGWFLQRLGKAWRWHVGGVDCDGGTPVTGRWTHVVATCTGQQLQLYQDGQLVAEKLAAINPGVWPGQLHIGQYSGQPGAGYQVNGRIASVRLYHRVLEVDEIEQLASTPPTP